MKTQSVSSYMLANATRNILAKAQADLIKAQQEGTTGFVYDRGLTLGSRTGQSISLRKEYDRLSVLTDTNGVIKERMTTSQDALGNVIKGTQSLLSLVTAMSSGAAGRTVAVDTAKNLIQSSTGLINTSFNGEYVFAGVNTDVKPLADYDAAGSPAHAAVLQSFEEYFGFPTTDPQVANISAADMKDYLDTAFAAEFDSDSWAANWSSASDTLVKSRIAPTEIAETSVSANSEGFRQMAMSMTMIAEFADIGLSQAALDEVVGKASLTTTDAITALADTQSFLGNAQARTKDATDRLEVQLKVLNNSVLDLEAVDPNEAASRVNALTMQIQASYALTVKIQSLSLLNYLK